MVRSVSYLGPFSPSQDIVHSLTEECWDKCVTDRPGQKLGGSTEVCRRHS